MQFKCKDEVLKAQNWWARAGSNCRPPRCQRGALPLSYEPFQLKVENLHLRNKKPRNHEDNFEVAYISFKIVLFQAIFCILRFCFFCF